MKAHILRIGVMGAALALLPSFALAAQPTPQSSAMGDSAPATSATSGTSSTSTDTTTDTQQHDDNGKWGWLGLLGLLGLIGLRPRNTTTASTYTPDTRR